MSDPKSYDFTLVLSGVPELTDEVCDALFEAGCDDSTPGQRAGVTFLHFAREADSARAAILSAISEVEGASIGARVARVEPDDLVTMAEIARRAGRSRESIRQLASGERGPGDFPAPMANLGERSPIWRWTDVARWLAEKSGNTAQPQDDLGTVVAAVNAALELRRQAEAIPNAEDLYESVLASGKAKRRAGKAGTRVPS
jgi:hypothetical protein